MEHQELMEPVVMEHQVQTELTGRVELTELRVEWSSGTSSSGTKDHQERN
jgi:hypothetical protein